MTRIEFERKAEAVIRQWLAGPAEFRFEADEDWVAFIGRDYP